MSIKMKKFIFALFLNLFFCFNVLSYTGVAPVGFTGALTQASLYYSYPTNAFNYSTANFSYDVDSCTGNQDIFQWDWMFQSNYEPGCSYNKCTGIQIFYIGQPGSQQVCGNYFGYIYYLNSNPNKYKVIGCHLNSAIIAPNYTYSFTTHLWSAPPVANRFSYYEERADLILAVLVIGLSIGMVINILFYVG
jgi:hypothetical protein